MFETIGTIRRCCHAEAKIAMQVLRTMTGDRKTIEIGTSKLSCKLCTTFLDVVSQKSPLNVVIRGSQGKIYSSWALPNDIPAEIRDEFTSRVNRMVENLFHRLQWAQGNSTPPPEILEDDWEQWRTSIILEIIDVGAPPLEKNSINTSNSTVRDVAGAATGTKATRAKRNSHSLRRFPPARHTPTVAPSDSQSQSPRYQRGRSRRGAGGYHGGRGYDSYRPAYPYPTR